MLSSARGAIAGRCAGEVAIHAMHRKVFADCACRAFGEAECAAGLFPVAVDSSRLCDADARVLSVDCN